MEKIKSSADKNISKEQLKRSIQLGHKIFGGEVDSVALEIDRSGPGKRKRKTDWKSESSVIGVEKEMKKRKSQSAEESESPPALDVKGQHDLTPWLKKIALSDKSSFQKKVLTTLCQVPRGRFTTYSAISKHLSSSPRAVGNALRNNPFAPQVPCHRVLASGGGLGGFHGSWGRNGKEGLHDDKKRKLLGDEGVIFDGKGRVVGSAWERFH